MSPKNLNVPSKTHKFLLDKLKDKRTLQIYKKFEKNLNINKNFIVAVSGGSDSLALSFLTKIYSIKKKPGSDHFTKIWKRTSFKCGLNNRVNSISNQIKPKVTKQVRDA